MINEYWLLLTKIKNITRYIMKTKIFYSTLICSSILLLWFIFSPLMNANPLDSGEAKIELNFERITPSRLIEKKINLQQLFDEYPAVSPYIVEFCYGLNLKSDSSLSASLLEFSQQSYILKTEIEINKRFADLTGHKQKIKSSISRLKAQFDTIRIPEEIVFANSNFTYNATCYNESILVGLERYIGGNHPIIIESLNPSEFPEWIRNGMNEKFMDRDILSAWISTKLFKETTGYHIEEMIRWGKIHLTTEMCLRLDNEDIPISDVLRWSEQQFEWALSNEGKFWKYLMDENLLFDSNEKNRAYLLNNGPYTIGLPEESPDRMGQFLGYRIVLNYIQNQNLELRDLLDTDYKIILKSYNP